MRYEKNEISGGNTKKAGNAAKDVKKGWDKGLPTDIGDLVVGLLTGKAPEYAGGAAKTLWNQVSPPPHDHSVEVKNPKYNPIIEASKARRAKLESDRRQKEAEGIADFNRRTNPAGWKTQGGSYYSRKRKGQNGNSAWSPRGTSRNSKSYSGSQKRRQQSGQRYNRASKYSGRYANRGTR